VLRRDSDGGEMLDAKTGQLTSMRGKSLRDDRLVISSFGANPPHVALERLLTVLRGVEVHLRFDTIATWAARAYQFTMSLRGSTLLQPTDRLSLLGFNFANAWAALKNQNSSAWDETLALVRLGLGDGIDTVNVDPDAGGGNVAVSLRRFDMAEPIPAANLSDGQLSWLAFVALARLHRGRSLLAIDEPELHLHPSLLGRVIALLTSIEGGAPLILCTHSDRVLELLDDPASATRVCSLDRGRVLVSRIDAEALPQWLERFDDLGRLRASGYLHRVLVPAA
jgi:predicted ATPase